jgi:hypothetical protein
MDEKAAQRLSGRIIGLFADDPDQSARPDLARAFELLPQPQAERVWRDGESVRFNVLGDERLFEGVLKVVPEGNDGRAIVVQLVARRLNNGVVDAEMEQRGYGMLNERHWTRAWVFWPGEQSVDVKRKAEDEQRFAQALAHRLAWAAPA